MSGDKKYFPLYSALLCTFALMVFSYFIHYELPLRLISFVSLAAAALIISTEIKTTSGLLRIAGRFSSSKERSLYVALGISGGILPIFYRWYLETSLLPDRIYIFAIIAALIGCLEELVFRGYIQESVKSINGPLSVAVSTLAHTSYKCCLFLAPVNPATVNVGFLAFWTFLAGIIFGTIRHYSKSVVPSLIAHAIFDIIVYAEFANAPWWVW
jgi:membrane protease YdiL (CAAX protease family)